MMIKLTDLEKKLLVKIIKDYGNNGIENTEFYNTFGINAAKNKEVRGAFSSLKKKKVINHYNDPGCFNPIFPTETLVQTCIDNGIEINDNAMKEINRYL